MGPQKMGLPSGLLGNLDGPKQGRAKIDVDPSDEFRGLPLASAQCPKIACEDLFGPG